MKKDGRKEMILPLFKSALNKTVEGHEGQSIGDYCGGENDKHIERRRRIACLPFNLTCASVIQQHLPDCAFGECGGFIPGLLLQAPTFGKKCCNFQLWKDEFFTTDNEGLPVALDARSKIVQAIIKGMTDHSNKLEQAVIVDKESIGYLKELALE